MTEKETAKEATEKNIEEAVIEETTEKAIEVVAEEVHFADSKKEANEYGPVPTNDGFMPVVDDTQLPF